MNKLIDAVKKSALDPVQTNDSVTISGRYCFGDDFIGFSGHFPGYPILPAVVQLTAALCLIEEHKGHQLQLHSVQNAKFLLEIRPGDEIRVQCTDFPVKDMPGSKIKILSGEKTAASFLMTFQDKGEGRC